MLLVACAGFCWEIVPDRAWHGKGQDDRLIPTMSRPGTAMFDLAAIQTALRDQGVDAWLLYDFRGLNVLARRVVGMKPEQMLSRRWFYLIPSQGEARKLVHRIEPFALDHLPGTKSIYLKWQELEAGVASLLKGHRSVAIEYVARNAN